MKHSRITRSRRWCEFRYLNCTRRDNVLTVSAVALSSELVLSKLFRQCGAPAPRQDARRTSLPTNLSLFPPRSEYPLPYVDDRARARNSCVLETLFAYLQLDAKAKSIAVNTATRLQSSVLAVVLDAFLGPCVLLLSPVEPILRSPVPEVPRMWTSRMT